VFAFRLGYLQEILRQHIEFEDYDDLLKKYSSLPKRSFDYEVVEKESLLSMVEYLGIWKDLGTWNTLTEVMADRTSGNVLLGDDCMNTHVLNELNIPIIVLGARDMVVAASPDGILVSDKQSSAHMKPYVDRIDQRLMFEERRWGRYTVLEYVDYPDGRLSLTQHLFLKAGAQLSYLYHASREEVLTIVDGTGFLVVDGSVRAIHRGDHVFISKGEKHALKATTDMHFIEVQIGEVISDEDKTQFEFEW
jgi:mannose-1-phosphate guanylyltransferase